MKWINDYLEKAVYVDGGRGPVEFDCWGLVRDVRRHLGLPELPSHGSLRNTDPRSFTKAYRKESSHMIECGPEHGAIAAVLVGQICVHVATVLLFPDGLRVLEINPTRAARCIKHSTWLQDHVKVTYHKDRPND